jgi:hypothetical protein
MKRLSESVIYEVWHDKGNLNALRHHGKRRSLERYFLQRVNWEIERIASLSQVYLLANRNCSQLDAREQDDGND